MVGIFASTRLLRRFGVREGTDVGRGCGAPQGRSARAAVREATVAAAAAIVEACGAEQLSMRRLAKDLASTPMALYHHTSPGPGGARRRGRPRTAIGRRPRWTPRRTPGWPGCPVGGWS
ncbi:hypothetical protein L6E12_11905 [Actinokineospora sp. PR83]|uniref:hypothetical protein n=1 Tax=Actinokineospora sp. PR83 TaxID=2884908 RepID=UPI001F3242D5|nr:hypothetical protein [Actinokineospora sp. PR83]MCG8916493.1 hypothetical protein [Actinokineospora sp. PR83]